MPDFSTLYSNNLEEIQMIAGDERTLIYSVFDEAGGTVNITSASPRIIVFKYGDPSHIFYSLSGSTVADADGNTFSVIFTGLGLSGVYQQQVIIEDSEGRIHVPAQGKITIFPSNPNY